MLKELVEGHEVEHFDLYAMDIRGCSGCLRCKKQDGCSIKDDMTTIYRAIEKADAVVIGSPIYMCEETACTKAFAERTYALLNNEGDRRPKYVPKLKGGKIGVAIFPCGNPLGRRSFRTVRKNYEKHFRTLGFDDWQVHIVPGIHPGVDALQDKGARRILGKTKAFLGPA